MLGSGNPCPVIDANCQNIATLCVIGLCVGFAVRNRFGSSLLNFPDIGHVIEYRLHHPFTFTAKLWRRWHEPVL